MQNCRCGTERSCKFSPVRKSEAHEKGIDSELVVLDSIVDSTFAAFADSQLTGAGDQGVAQVGQEFYDQLSTRLGERLKQCGTRVPVITGKSSRLRRRWPIGRSAH